MPRSLRCTATFLAVLTLALAGCTPEPLAISSTRLPDAPPTAIPTADGSGDPDASAEELTFFASGVADSPPYSVPEIAADELARVLVDRGELQTVPVASPPPAVAGFRLLGACEPDADASLIVTPSDAGGPFTRFTIPCDGAQHLARIGSATPLTPPYSLTVEDPDTGQTGYVQLLEDDSTGTR